MTTAVESKLARLTVDVNAPVARLVLRNSPLNVIDVPMMEELAQALGEIEARSDVSVICAERRGPSAFRRVSMWRHTLPIKSRPCCSSFTR